MGCHGASVALSHAKAHRQLFMLDTAQWTGPGAAEERNGRHHTEPSKIFRILGREPILTFTVAPVTL